MDLDLIDMGVLAGGVLLGVAIVINSFNEKRRKQGSYIGQAGVERLLKEEREKLPPYN